MSISRFGYECAWAVAGLVLITMIRKRVERGRADLPPPGEAVP